MASYWNGHIIFSSNEPTMLNFLFKNNVRLLPCHKSGYSEHSVIREMKIIGLFETNDWYKNKFSKRKSISPFEISFSRETKFKNMSNLTGSTWTYLTSNWTEMKNNVWYKWKVWDKTFPFFSYFRSQESRVWK